MNHRSNNFDFVRFLAAFFVVYGHCEALSGTQAIQIAGQAIQGLGVLIFFSLSGYLVTNSLRRHPSAAAFLAKRCLRIFPALAVVVTLSTYLLGPAMTTLSLHDYFQNELSRHYMRAIGLYISYYLPGVFEKQPYPGAVNGSLWSLPAEFLCYLIVAATAFLPMRFGRMVLALGIGATISLNLILPYYKGPQLVYYGTDLFQWSAVAVYFFVGAVYYAFRIRLRPAVGIIAAGLLLAAPEFLSVTESSMLLCIGLPYVILSLGGQATPVLHRWGRCGDLSYGMYLYSFPITQTIIALTHNGMEVHILIACVTALSAGCAFLSWHLIEKWALRLKPQAENVGRWPSLLKGAPIKFFRATSSAGDGD